MRGGVHQEEAYAKTLSDLSGVDITRLLPVPEISSTQFPDAKKYMRRGDQPPGRGLRTRRALRLS